MYVCVRTHTMLKALYSCHLPCGEWSCLAFHRWSQTWPTHRVLLPSSFPSSVLPSERGSWPEGSVVNRYACVKCHHCTSKRDTGTEKLQPMLVSSNKNKTLVPRDRLTILLWFAQKMKPDTVIELVWFFHCCLWVSSVMITPHVILWYDQASAGPWECI